MRKPNDMMKAAVRRNHFNTFTFPRGGWVKIEIEGYNIVYWYIQKVEGRVELYAELVSVSTEMILMTSKTLEESWIECQTKHCIRIKYYTYRQLSKLATKRTSEQKKTLKIYGVTSINLLLYHALWQYPHQHYHQVYTSITLWMVQ